VKTAAASTAAESAVNTGGGVSPRHSGRSTGTPGGTPGGTVGAPPAAPYRNTGTGVNNGSSNGNNNNNAAIMRLQYPNDPNNPFNRNTRTSYNNPSRMNIPEFRATPTTNQQVMYFWPRHRRLRHYNTNDMIDGMQKIGKEQNHTTSWATHARVHRGVAHLESPSL